MQALMICPLKRVNESLSDYKNERINNPNKFKL